MQKQKLIIALVLLFSGLLLLSGCTQQKKADGSVGTAPGGSSATETAPSPSAPIGGFVKGVSLSPKSFQAEDFTGFFAEAKEAGSVVSWSGDWQELGSENSGAKVVAELASVHGYAPAVIAQFFTQSDGGLLRPLDSATKESYKESAAAFAEKYNPAYMGFGIEVNILYEKSPSDFEEFAKFYSGVYDAVKAASPETKVFTVFQLEKMKGMHGGLFGGENNPDNAEWQLLEKFPKSDLIALTTYPGLIYSSPGEIPEDYYAGIKQHTAKPIAFTEIGWHSRASPAGFESSESEQAEFISTFFRLSKGLNKKLAIWSFLYDPSTHEPFNSMGLRRADGSARPAWDVWVGAK